MVAIQARGLYSPHRSYKLRRADYNVSSKELSSWDDFNLGNSVAKTLLGVGFGKASDKYLKMYKDVLGPNSIVQGLIDLTSETFNEIADFIVEIPNKTGSPKE